MNKIRECHQSNFVMITHYEFTDFTSFSCTPQLSETSPCSVSVFLGQLLNVAFAMYQAPLPLISLKQQTIRGRRAPEALASPHL